MNAAAEIVTATASFRAQSGRTGIGRTRIGVEYGPVVLGDVGSGAKIDDTAHGAAVNLAARLQELGRNGGPAVVIGPQAARLARQSLVALGAVEMRSFGAVQVFTLPAEGQIGRQA